MLSSDANSSVEYIGGRRDGITATDSERYDLFDKVVMEFLGDLNGRLHEVTKPLPNLLQAV